MRYIIAMILVLCAAPCFATAGINLYVSAGDTRARNLPAYGYTPDSPVITVTYGKTKLVSTDTNFPDTMWVYGYSCTGDTSDYMQDYVTLSDQYVKFRGVSVGSDSPTFGSYSGYRSWSTPIFNYGSNFLTSGKKDGIISIDGFAFRNINMVVPSSSHNAVIQCQPTVGTDSKVFLDVQNCLFFNITYTGDTLNGVIGHREYGGGVDDTNKRGVVRIYNSSFVNVNAVYCPTPRDLPVNVYAYIDHCTVRNAKYIVNGSNAALNGGSDTTIITNTIIDGCTEVFNTGNDGAIASTCYISYTDTYNCGMGDAPSIGVGNISIQPTWTNMLTDTYSTLAYFSDPISLTTASSTGGIIGVSWGYYVPVSVIGEHRRESMVNTFRRLLWRNR